MVIMLETKYRMIGAKIKYYRQLKGIDQNELASEVGISPQYLSKIECGKQMPSMEVFLLIADKLNVDPAKIISNNKKNEEKFN